MTVGYTSISTKASMDCPRLALFPTSSSKCASTQQVNNRPPPPLAFGATNDVPLSFSSSSTVSVYNKSDITISTTCAIPSSRTIRSPKIGKVLNLPPYISNRTTSNESADSPWMDVFRSSYIVTIMHYPRNPSFISTNTQIFIMTPWSSMTQRPTSALLSKH